MPHKFKVRKDDYLRGIYSRESERPKIVLILTIDDFGRSLSYSSQMARQLPLLADSTTAIGSAMLQKRLFKKEKPAQLRRISIL
ncbi:MULTISPECIES: hypothetical protein [unclassified Microcoleus]|uniref:hypothetical protein n=1 Tax=unclassified Microcoleus TaxID=2642155 RepID=UPI002FD541E8